MLLVWLLGKVEFKGIRKQPKRCCSSAIVVKGLWRSVAHAIPPFNKVDYSIFFIIASKPFATRTPCEQSSSSTSFCASTYRDNALRDSFSLARSQGEYQTDGLLILSSLKRNRRSFISISRRNRVSRHSSTGRPCASAHSTASLNVLKVGTDPRPSTGTDFPLGVRSRSSKVKRWMSPKKICPST